MFDYGPGGGQNPYAQQALMGMAQSPPSQGAFQFPQINAPQLSAFPYADPYLTGTGNNQGGSSQVPTSYYFGGNTVTMTNPAGGGAAPQQQQTAQGTPASPAAPPAGSGQNNQVQPQSGGGGFTYTPINSLGSWGQSGNGGFGNANPINFGGSPGANQIYGTGF
jgi:hypothetical protein